MSKIDLNIQKHVEQANINRSQDTGRAAQAEQQQQPAQSGVSSPTDSDRIKVSERASTVGRLASRAAELPEVRQEKVAAVRERIQSGSYNPSASDIADAILKDEK